MRLFIALDPPPHILPELNPLLEFPLASAKRVPLEQIHLTLRFLGECSAELLEAAKTHCAAIQSLPFSLHMKGVGCFPNSAQPRVLWVGVEAPPRLFELQSQVERTVQAMGLAPEPKAFHPHFTLARFKTLPKKGLGEFVERFKDFTGTPWQVDHFTLYSSRLTPQGALHHPEAHFPL